MELNEVLKTRRSIRKYKADPVSRETVNELIFAAQQAPTWKNSQTGRYYVVTSPEMLDKVKTLGLPERNKANCLNAPVIIVTTYVKGISGYADAVNPANELGDTWGAYDLGLQNENLLLKAAELGLGTLVMGIRDSAALRELLSIPDNEEVAAVISVGYPDISPAMPKRKALEEIAAWF